jgi:cytochrome c peroxidase
LTAQAREGLIFFQGKAECASCHRLTDGRFTDSQFHHSGIGLIDIDGNLGQLASVALRRKLDVTTMGSAVGEDAKLSALGRFLVSHQAEDIGAFRTPSLRNVAVTAPYMHDGSIATLEQAVDVEIYYRGLSTGRPISLTVEERKDLLAFLQSLTTELPTGYYQPVPAASDH